MPSKFFCCFFQDQQSVSVVVFSAKPKNKNTDRGIHTGTDKALTDTDTVQHHGIRRLSWTGPQPLQFRQSTSRQHCLWRELQQVIMEVPCVGSFSFWDDLTVAMRMEHDGPGRPDSVEGNDMEIDLAGIGTLFSP